MSFAGVSKLQRGKQWITVVSLLMLAACAGQPPRYEPVQEVAPARPVEVNNLGMAVSVPPELLRQSSMAPSRYVVQKGDTLWDISSLFLANPWLWPEIWLANPQIQNPHLIYPGDVVSLEWVNGKPVIRIERGGIEKLTPRVRSTDLAQPVPALPMDAIRSFLGSAQFIDQAAAESAPYMLAAADGHLMAAEGMDIFARRFGDSTEKRWQILRAGQRYYDPETKELLGQEGIAVGTAVVLKSGDPARLVIEESLREALRGDLLFPVPEEDYTPELLLQPVPRDTDARVIAGFDVVTIVGQYQIVTLNLGSDQDLKAGATFEAFGQDETIEDTVAGEGEQVVLPGEYCGLAVVFRVDQKVAHALVMSAQQALRVGDHLRSPLLSNR